MMLSICSDETISAGRVEFLVRQEPFLLSREIRCDVGHLSSGLLAASFPPLQGCRYGQASC
jgi:hypothetical protein